MAKIPIKIISDGARNVAGGIGHRSLGPFDAFTVVGSGVSEANVAGGIIPMSADEYAAAMLDQLGQRPAVWLQQGKGISGTATATAWADQSGNGRNFAEVGGSGPVNLAYAGTRYGYLPGVVSNFFSMGDVALGTDLDVRIRLSMDDWTPASASFFMSKFDNGGGKYAFEFHNNGVAGTLAYQWSADGSTAVATKNSSVAPTVSDGAIMWVRVTHDVDNGSGSNDVKFYTSTDDTNDPDQVTWTQLGTTQSTAGTTSIANTANGILLGAWNAGANGNLAGKIYRAAVYEGINGTKIVDFNPSEANDGVSSFVSSSTGETWTVNTSGSLPAQIVGRSSLLFNGTSHYLATGAGVITLSDPFTWYLLGKQVSWTSTDTILASSGDDCNISQSTSTPRINQYAGASANENANLAIGSYGAVCAVFNGASSLTQINNTTPVSGGNPGAISGNQIFLCANGSGAGNYSNWQALEIIGFSAAHNATQRTLIIKYLLGIGSISA